MFRFLTPWEGRLALLFALALATAFTAGCENPPGCVDGDCAGDDDAVDDDDDGANDDDDVEFNATLHVVVPYGWTALEISFKEPGDLHFDTLCGEDVDECSITFEEPGRYEVLMVTWTWACVPQILFLDEDDAGQTIELDEVWEGTGVCSLTPDGTYGTFNVNSGAGWIGIGSWDNAVATENTFFVDTRSEGGDGDMLLEGEIAEDLSWIYYHRITVGGDESEATLPLMDE